MSGTRDTFADGEGGSAAPEGVVGRDDAAGEASDGGALNARQRREERRYGEVARENAALKERLRGIEARLAEAEEAGNRSRVAALERDLDAAQREAAAAFADGDPEKHVQAVRKIADAAVQKAVVAAPAKPAAGGGNAPRYTATTQAWLDANPWFGSDEAATKVARGAHGSALAAGMVADTPEYWAFVREKVERAHPGIVRDPDGDRTDAGGAGSAGAEDAGEGDDASRARSPARPPVGGAAPVTRPSAGTTRPGGEFRLSAEQVEAAKIAGVTPQQYAAALRAGQKTGAFVPAARRQA